MSEVSRTKHQTRLDEHQRLLVTTHRYVAQQAVDCFGARLVRWMTLDDAEQQASLGLILAARTFRRNVGVPFAGFAWRHCVGAMLRALLAEERQFSIAEAVVDCLADQRREGNVLTDTAETASKELRKHATLAMMALVVAATYVPAKGAEEHLSELQARTAVREATGGLDEHFRRVIELHYFEHIDMVEVAKRLDVSYPTARRHRAMALAQLKQLLRAKGVTDD